MRCQRGRPQVAPTSGDVSGRRHLFPAADRIRAIYPMSSGKSPLWRVKQADAERRAGPRVRPEAGPRTSLKPAPTACNASLRWVVFHERPGQAIDRQPQFFRIFVFGKTTLPLTALPDCPGARHDFGRRDRPTPAASSPIHNVQHRMPDIGTNSGTTSAIGHASIP